MKKIIITLAVALSTLSSFANEGKETVSQKVLDVFKTEFAGASEVSWTTSESYYRANFKYNNQHVTAYYSMEGEMLGMTRYISSLDLPIKLQASLKKTYCEYWIADLFEVSNNEGTSYYITMENADSRIVLKSTLGGSWSVFKKTTKA